MRSANALVDSDIIKVYRYALKGQQKICHKKVHPDMPEGSIAIRLYWRVDAGYEATVLLIPM